MKIKIHMQDESVIVVNEVEKIIEIPGRFEIHPKQKPHQDKKLINVYEIKELNFIMVSKG